MELGNFTGEKETRCWRKYSICFSIGMMYSLQTSVAVSSPSSFHASSRTGSSQCHSQRSLCCFGGCCLAVPMALQRQLSDVKTTEWLSRGLGSIVHPRPCCSMWMCPSLGEQCRQCCLLTPSPAAAPLWGTASGAGKGMCTNPALPGELPRPEAKVCVSSLLPLGSVPLSDSPFEASHSISGEI